MKLQHISHILAHIQHIFWRKWTLFKAIGTLKVASLLSFDVLDLRGLDGTTVFISKNGVLWKIIQVIVVNLSELAHAILALGCFCHRGGVQVFIGSFIIIWNKYNYASFAFG